MNRRRYKEPKNASLDIKKNHQLHKLYSVRKYKQPLKRSKTGYEIEMAVLDNEGRISSRVPEILKVAKRRYPEIPVDKEIPKHVIEIRSFPRISVHNTGLTLIENTEKVMEIVNSMDCVLFPFGTYPGTVKPRPWKVERYNVSSVALGTKRYYHAFSVCQGFHCHYTMPRGVFDHDRGFLKTMINSKVKQTLVDSYNMLIAMDPVLTTLLQSSPFSDGKYLAKDSRMLIWRGGKK